MGADVRTRFRASLGVVGVAASVLVASCGAPAPAPAPASSSTDAAGAAGAENNPIGDIPDTQVYVPFTGPDNAFTLSVPEGWARTDASAVTTFTDKLNTVRIEARPNATPPTPDSVKRDEMATIDVLGGGFSVETVTRKAGEAVLATYQAPAPPNVVTGKVGTDAVERYSFWRAGREVILTLSGPVGADNVDPWRTITDSFQWR